MQSISAADFKEQLNQLHLLDIRTPREWDDFNLRGVHIPLDHLLDRIEEVQAIPQPITVICYNGTQSSIACRLLLAKGISCQNLAGGLEAYLGV
ncbi:rhodanese-like domain-containing protein [Aquirufa rosea]|uniref:Rhodanese-like domain-containing protein n=1 Tax=Aquirufa rosea TaxID=2509241 RepID=A0A4Q1C2Q5_9BACT|nr:rhodanese-like domain-containing protein [Aquirufa rosea]RXK52554.1 rhodanese-like domain-containing protein [Aquirufa rosea]